MFAVAAALGGCLSDPGSSTPDAATPTVDAAVRDAPAADAAPVDGTPGADAPAVIATPNTQSVQFEESVDRFLFVSELADGTVDLSGAATFEAWFKLASIPADGETMALVVKSDGGEPDNSSYSFELTSVGGTLRFVAAFEGAPLTGGLAVDALGFDWPDLTINEWRHVAVSYDVSAAEVPARFRFYRDGAPVPSGDVVDLSSGEPIALIRDSTVDMLVGVRVTSGAIEHRFDGLIDELRLWSVVRHPSAIAARYQTELTGSETGLVAYWPFDGNADDSGPQGLDLSIIGGVVLSKDTPF